MLFKRISYFNIFAVNRSWKEKGNVLYSILLVFFIIIFKKNYIFLLFLKTDENTFYLFSKNHSLFYFVFKNCF